MSNLTKRAITNSFMSLLNKKPLDKITVKDIVEDCGVNRNTFYYHYQDIYALLQDVFESEMKEFVEKYRGKENWQEGVKEATEFALENKKAIFHVFNSMKRELLEKYLFDVADVLMQQVVADRATGLNVSEEDLRYVTVFYKHAVVGIVIEWLLTGMKANPQHVIERMGEIFDGNIRYTLEKIAKK